MRGRPGFLEVARQAADNAVELRKRAPMARCAAGLPVGRRFGAPWITVQRVFPLAVELPAPISGQLVAHAAKGQIGVVCLLN